MKSVWVRLVALGILSAPLVLIPWSAAAGASAVVAPAHSSTEVVAGSRLVGRAGTQPVCSKVEPAGFARCDVVVWRRASPLSSPRPGVVRSSAMIGDNGAYSPSFLRSAYGVRVLGATSNAGAGRVVAVVDAFDNANLFQDLNYYRNVFGMTPCHRGVVSSGASDCVFQQVNEVGQASPLPAANLSWGFEEATDVEMVSALCVNCQILVVEASSSSMVDLGASVNTAVNLGATVVSNSYGSSEYPGEVADARSYFNHPGVPIVAAGGDSGYGVQFPAASPTVVSVGGTTLVQKSSDGVRKGSETVWSGSGSGCSLYEPKPPWQHDTHCANRTLNDVAALGNPRDGVWVYDASEGPGMLIAGGTSVSTAVISSLYALASSSWPAGASPAEQLYRHSEVMYRVTSGSNADCGTYLCDAAKSQDFYNGPSGVGTPGGSPSNVAALAAPSDQSTPVLTNALAGNGEVTLQWSAPPSGANAPLGYDVWFASTGSSIVKFNAAPITGTNFRVTGLTNGRSYRFALDAVYPSTVSSLSNQVVATPLISPNSPRVPAGVIALAGDGAVTLGWTPLVGSGGLEIASYLITDRRGHTCRYSVSSSSVDSCTVSGLANGTSVRFRVIGLDAVGVPVASKLSRAVVPEVTLGVRQLAVGTDFACALLSDGHVKCWGANASGQLGNGTFTSSGTLARVEGLSNVVYVAAGTLNACAVTAGGQVQCWGDNSSGQLGNGANASLPGPTIVQGVTGATQVSVGVGYACALITGGQVQCWGDNSSGQLGNGTTTSAPVAVVVSGVTSALAVQASFNHTCAVTIAGDVSCWGSNAQGQLGSGTSGNLLTAHDVVGLTQVTHVSMGLDSTCALRSDQTVWCWGYNGDGELGRTGPAFSSTPLMVAGLPMISALSTSDYGSCAVDVGGIAWCWGYQSATSSPALSDVAVSAPRVVSEMSGVVVLSRAGADGFGCAVLATGALVCWSAGDFTPTLVKGPSR